MPTPTPGAARPLRLLGLLLLAGSLLAGCSLTGAAVRTLTPALDPFLEGLFAEGDLELAEPAFATDLHLLEGLRRTRDSARLAELQAMALTGYALLYAELCYFSYQTPESGGLAVAGIQGNIYQVGIVPAVGEISWFLGQGENSCGVSPLGPGASGPRQSDVCLLCPHAKCVEGAALDPSCDACVASISRATSVSPPRR